MPSTHNYLPVTSLLSADDLPEALSFIDGGLDALIPNLFVKEIQFVNTAGSTRSFYVQLIAFQNIGFTVPGLDLEFSINPGTLPNTTEFDLTLQFDWEILRYFDDFEFSRFDGSPQSFFDLLLTVTDPLDERLLTNAVLEIELSEDVQSLVNKINAEYGGSSVSMPSATELSDQIDDLIAQIDASGSLPSVREILFTIYVLPASDLSSGLDAINRLYDGGGLPILSRLQEMLVPRVRAGTSLGLEVAIPRSFLLPLQPSGEPYAEPSKYVLRTEPAQFTFDTRGSFGIDQSTQVTTGIDTDQGVSGPTVQIGNSGFTFQVDNVWLDLSRTTNIQPIQDAGYPADFRGVFIEEIEVGFPPILTQNGNPTEQAILKGRNLIIGSGGFSGTIGLETRVVGEDEYDSYDATLGGFGLELKEAEVEFRQGSLVRSSARATLNFPENFNVKDSEGNPAELEVTIQFFENGDFTFAAIEPEGLVLSFPSEENEVFKLTLRSLSLEKLGEVYALEVAGELEITAPVPGGLADKLLPGKIPISKLRIYSNGRIEFDGGVQLLPRTFDLKLGPAKIQVSALTLGTYEQDHEGQLRQYAYFGFDGSLNLQPAGLDVRGDGIQFFFTIDTDAGAGKAFHSFLRIQRLEIRLIIPGTASKEQALAIIEGYLALLGQEQGGSVSEYRGAVGVSFPRLKLKFEGDISYVPDDPSFLVDAKINLPTPIPLGPTGLGIYGFRGLVGSGYIADKSAIGLADSASWWQYYKAPPKEGITVDKFSKEPGFVGGAGTAIATKGDPRIFSSKVFLLLTAPETLLLQGQAGILRRQVGLDDREDPPFSAFLAVSPESITGGAGVQARLPQSSGVIADISANMEFGFFFQNPGGWYLNIGEASPPSKRIRARILRVFNLNAYLQLSARGVALGAGASFNLDKRFGPIRFRLYAYLDMGVRISTEPVQAGGHVLIAGGLEIGIWKFRFGFGVGAYLGAEAPRPFIIEGYIEVKIKIPFKRKKKGIRVSLRWVFDRRRQLEPFQILEPSNAVKALNMTTLEEFPIAYLGSALEESWFDLLEETIIPQDSFVDIQFNYSLKPKGKDPVLSRMTGRFVPTDNVVKISPRRGHSDQVQHRFHLDKVEILTRDPVGDIWVPYDPYEALPIKAFLDSVPASLLHIGAWQAHEQPRQKTHLRILARNPFAFLSQGTGPDETNIVEDYGLNASLMFCTQPLVDWECLNWQGQSNGFRRYREGEWKFDRKAWIKIDIPSASSRKAIQVVEEESEYAPGTNLTEALVALQEDELEKPMTVSIRFPEPVTAYRLTYRVDPCGLQTEEESSPALHIQVGESVQVASPNHGGFTFGGSFSIVAWLKQTPIDETLVNGQVGQDINDHLEVLFKKMASDGHGITIRTVLAPTQASGYSLFVELHYNNRWNGHIRIVKRFVVAEAEGWHMITVQRTGTQLADYYLTVNGQPSVETWVSESTGTPGDVYNDGPIILGEGDFEGYVDHIQYYQDFVLSAQEIDDQYEGGRCAVNANTTNLRLWWKLDELQGTQATNSGLAWTNSDGVLTGYTSGRTQIGGGAWVEETCGGQEGLPLIEEGTSLCFNASGQKVEVGHIAEYLDVKTVEAWFKPEVDPQFTATPSNYFDLYEASQIVVSKMSASGPTQLPNGIVISVTKWLDQPTDKVKYAVFVQMGSHYANREVEFEQLEDPEWVFVSAAFNGSWRIIINSQTAYSFPSGPAGGLYLGVENDQPLFIGSLRSDIFANNNKEYLGCIGQVRLYNRELFESEQRAQYELGRCAQTIIANGLIGWWKLNEQEGTVAADSSPLDNNGVLQQFAPALTALGGGAWATEICLPPGEPPARGGALCMSDPDHRVSIPAITPYKNNIRAFEIWAKPVLDTGVTSSPDYTALIDRGEVVFTIFSSTTYQGNWLRLLVKTIKWLDSSTNEIVYSFYVEAGTALPPGGPPPDLRYPADKDPEWLFISASGVGFNDELDTDFTSKWNFQIQDQPVIGVYPLGPFATSNLVDVAHIHLGNSPDFVTWLPNKDFDGCLSQARLYNRAFSIEQQLAHFRRGRCAEDIERAGLIGWWKLDELEGTVAHDSSPYANHGILEDFAPALTALNGGAWQYELCGLQPSCLRTLTFDGGLDNMTQEAVLSVLGGGAEYREVSLIELCWETEATRRFNEQQVEINETREEQLAYFGLGLQNVLQPVWRPNGAYAIRIEGRDVVEGNTSNQSYVFGFKTGGPIRHYFDAVEAAQQVELENLENEGLYSLKPYLDFGRSYPSVDGNLIGAKPLYYKQGHNDLRVFFKQPGTYNLFGDWPANLGSPALANKLDAIVKETETNQSLSLTSESDGWIREEEASYSLDTQVIHNMAVNSLPDGANCTKFQFDLQKGYYFFLSPPDLRREKLYTVHLVSQFEGVEHELHKYAVQTSRYGSFAEHIGSIDLGEGREAIYNLEHIQKDQTVLAQILADSLAPEDPLRQEYAMTFDRIMRAGLGLDALEVPTTTEVNIFRIPGSGSFTYGMLVRSPEPLCDPRAREQIFSQVLRITLPGQPNLGPGFTPVIIPSKDCTQVFITTTYNVLPFDEIELHFQEMIYNGYQFVAKGSAVTRPVSLLIP